MTLGFLGTSLFSPFSPSPSSSNLSSGINANFWVTCVQVLPLLDNRCLPHNNLHIHEAMAYIATPIVAGYRYNGVVHPIHPLDRRTHCDFDRAVGTDWECQFELSALCPGCGEPWAEY